MAGRAVVHQIMEVSVEIRPVTLHLALLAVRHKTQQQVELLVS